MHNWDDFRYFLAVVECGSISGAASQIGVNHSTVSRRLQQLEQRHGVRLFERTDSGYVLTDAGASIVDFASQIEQSAMQASRVLAGRDARLEGNIVVTMPHDLFESCLVAPLRQFCLQYPAIELTLSVTHGLRNLANREADIAVRLTPTPPDYLVGKRLTRIQHGIYGHRRLNWQKNTPVIVWGGEKSLPQWAQLHFHRPRVALRVDDLVSMHSAVAEGYGVARMPCFFPDRVAHPEVIRLPISLPRSDWGLWLLSHVDLKNSARVMHCKRFLEASLVSQLSHFRGEVSAEAAGLR